MQIGYSSTSRSPRGFKRPTKTKSRSKTQKSRRSETYTEGYATPPQRDIISLTLHSLDNLGNQTFAMPPFQVHYDRWLSSLQIVLNDFESSHAAPIDSSYLADRDKILDDIKIAFNQLRLQESLRVDAIRRLEASKSSLSAFEQAQVIEIKTVVDRIEKSVKPVKEKVEALQLELDSVRGTRAGLFAGVSKKIKAQKENEAVLKLRSAEKDLEETVTHVAAEEANLRADLERRKVAIMGKIALDQNEVKKLELASQIDNSIEVRRRASQGLIEAVNSLLMRAKIAT